MYFAKHLVLYNDMYPKNPPHAVMAREGGDRDSAPASACLEATLLHLMFPALSRHGVVTLEGPASQLGRLAAAAAAPGRGPPVIGQRDLELRGQLLTTPVLQQDQLTVDVPLLVVLVGCLGALPVLLLHLCLLPLVGEGLGFVSGVLAVDRHGGVLYKEVLQRVGHLFLLVRGGALEGGCGGEDPGPIR